MTFTARVRNNNNEITLDTFGYNQFMLKEGTLAAADAEISPSYTYTTAYFNNVDFYGAMEWWPDPYALDRSTGYSSTIHTTNTPGGVPGDLSCWEVFGKPMSRKYRLRTDGYIHGGMFWSGTSLATSTTNSGQPPNKGKNELTDYFPPSMVGGSLQYTDDSYAVLPEDSNGNVYHFLYGDSMNYHSRNSTTGTTVFNTTIPTVGTSSGSNTSDNNARFSNAGVTVSFNSSTGHKLQTLTVGGSNILSSWTGHIYWVEANTSNVEGPKRFQQVYVSGNCIGHIFSNDYGVTWSVGSEDSQTYPSNTKLLDIEALHYNGRYYRTTYARGGGVYDMNRRFPEVPRYTYMLYCNSNQSGYGLETEAGIHSVYLTDSLVSHTAGKVQYERNARMFFKVTDGDYLGFGPGQWQNVPGRTKDNNKNGQNMFLKGVMSTMSSVDYFVAGGIRDNDLSNTGVAIETRDANGELTYTTRTDKKEITLDGFEINYGTWQNGTTAVISGVPTDAYISIPYYDSLFTALPNASNWMSNAIEGYMCLPWIYRSGTNIYIRWYGQQRTINLPPSNVPVSEYPHLSTPAIPIMIAEKPV